MTICDFDVFVRIHLHTRSSSVRSRHWSLSQFIWMSKRTWCTSMLHLSLTTVCVMCTMQPIQDDQATEKQPDMFLSSIHPPLRWQGEQYKTWTKYKRKTHVFTFAFFSTNICLTNFVNIHTSLPSFFWHCTRDVTKYKQYGEEKTVFPCLSALTSRLTNIVDIQTNCLEENIGQCFYLKKILNMIWLLRGK